MRLTVTRAELGGGGPGDAPDDRYHRQSLMPWWDQGRVSGARVLVVGAGALGCEALKTLALMGVGSVLVYDMDAIERSNLSRGVLFRDADVGRPKAEVAVAALPPLCPALRGTARTLNVVHGAGLGVFVWADVVLGCVDNREARIFVNTACARTGRVWIDGAIEGLSGIVRGFDPARGACYECTMSAVDRRMVAERRSCAMLARDVVARGHVPTTAVAASIVGALQVQEALKLLHGEAALVGEGLHLDGRWSEWSRARYPRRDDCTGHDAYAALETLDACVARTTVGELLERAERRFGEGATLELSRDVVLRLTCPACGDSAPGRAVLGAVTERSAACPACGTHRVVEVASSFTRDDGDAVLARTLGDLGLPPFDVVVARRGLDDAVAWLLAGDAAEVLGDVAPRAGERPLGAALPAASAGGA